MVYNVKTLDVSFEPILFVENLEIHWSTSQILWETSLDWMRELWGSILLQKRVKYSRVLTWIGVWTKGRSITNLSDLGRGSQYRSCFYFTRLARPTRRENLISFVSRACSTLRIYRRTFCSTNCYVGGIVRWPTFRELWRPSTLARQPIFTNNRRRARRFHFDVTPWTRVICTRTARRTRYRCVTCSLVYNTRHVRCLRMFRSNFSLRRDGFPSTAARQCVFNEFLVKLLRTLWHCLTTIPVFPSFPPIFHLLQLSAIAFRYPTICYWL